MTDVMGACPNCETFGEVGQPCAERGCQRRAFHFIPAEYAAKLALTAHAPVDALIGRKVDDYLAVDVLGQGGFGKVYLALQMPIRMEAALKLLDQASLDDDATAGMLARKFEGEAQALAQVFHPNIVRLLKYGAYDGIPFLVMEYVKGGRTLKQEIAEYAEAGQPIDSEVIRKIIRQVVDALDAAHALHIIHRDIKPDNIMLQRVAGNDHLVRILDFGLAKFVAERAENSAAMGTPAYMAPEQWARKSIGPWTDLYALGVMSFEMITGRRPFPGRALPEILRKKLDPNYDPTVRLSGLGAPPYLCDFLRAAIRPNAEDRIQTASEFRAALDDVFDRLRADAERVSISRSVDVSDLLSEELAVPAQVSPDAMTLIFDELGTPSMATGQTGDSEAVTMVFDPPTTGARTDSAAQTPRRRRGLWYGLAAAAILAAGVAIAIAVSGG